MKSPTASSNSRNISRRKFVVFSLAPCLILFGVAEVIVRVTGLASPSMHSKPLPEEAAGLYQPDRELFWSLRPRYDGIFQDAHVTVNSRGVRGPEVGPKAAGEFRILSLGESTTFGVGVGHEDTYAAVLQKLLNENQPQRTPTVINAGVPAYSSFQSLKYLELRGLSLEPDLVLFYHEVNDYLPSALRDSSNTEVGVTKTDRQLYESNVDSLLRSVAASSALVQLLQREWSLYRIRRFSGTRVDNPVLQIGLPNKRIASRMVVTGQGDDRQAGLNEIAIGRRVSETERLQNLTELAQLCKSRGVKLVILHPSYRESQRHECVLTRFCAATGVPMIEVYDVLHPAMTDPAVTYLDTMHPNAHGHRLLAETIYRYLESQGWLRAARQP